MPASEARIVANRSNALKSTGPKTEEGKARSRGNSLKHGLTGAGVVLPEEDAAEVDRRFVAFRDELKPSGEVGLILVRRAATLSVRMERGADQESAALAERVREALDEFEAPEGIDDDEADRLRAEAGRRAMFDPSKEATLARKYEAAAERGFFRALKELRQVEEAAKADDPVDQAAVIREALASFSSYEAMDAEFDILERKLDLPPMPKPNRPAGPPPIGRVDVPFSIGRGR